MSNTMQGFRDAPKAKAGHHGCPVCHEPNTVHLGVQAMSKHDGWARNESGYTAQRGISMCDTHALQLWNQLVDLLMAARK
jgi:hypothetical protein